MSQWLLTRRMFLLDVFSGISTKTQSLPTAVQYLKSVKLVYVTMKQLHVDETLVITNFLFHYRVQAQREIENEGNIYPPFMVLEYGQITNENISLNGIFPVTFMVEFYMENDILHYVDVRIPDRCARSANNLNLPLVFCR